MKKVTLLLLAGLVLAGCEEYTDQQYRSNTYIVNGKPLMCFNSLPRRLSCNWERYNEQD
jgi:hypothetical protein